jgi:hypothetical protein
MCFYSSQDRGGEGWILLEKTWRKPGENLEKTWRKPGENLEKPGDTGEDMELDKK